MLVKEKNEELEVLENEINFLELEIDNLLRQNILYEELINEYEVLEDNLNNQIKILESKVKPKTVKPTRGGTLRDFTVTSYDLSVASCGKPIGSKGYGITASGISLIGHTWESARSIAVDPKVIPLGSKVEVIFSEPGYSKYNGIYNAVDKGGAIKGNIIDFFMGDFNQNEEHPSVSYFGRTKANIKIVE